VYVDSAADLDMAERIAVNAKTQRPGVCNAMETLLVHQDVAREFVPRIAASYAKAGVEVRGDPDARRLGGTSVKAARTEDFDTEFLDLTVAVRVVSSLDEAIAHINRHGSHHSDSIVTRTPPSGSSGRSTPPPSSITPPRACTTAPCSGSAPRWGFPLRNSTPAAPWASASSRRRNTSCTAPARSGDSRFLVAPRPPHLAPRGCMKLGLFGGSFDPVHNGHLALARAALRELKLDRVYFVPAVRPPHKAGRTLAPTVDRLRMLELAVKSLPGVYVDRWELRQKGVSYTYKTLRAFLRRHSGAECRLLVGGDSWRKWRTWRRWRELLRDGRPVVGLRRGVARGRVAGAAFLKAALPKISSSEIRARVKAGRSVSRLVPPGVAAYIRRRGLYRP
jgi:nicotinate (nicotinamide) nucleotide adenylyltransferase